MKNLITTTILLCCTLLLPSCQNDDWKEEVEKLRNELNVQKQLLEASQNNIYITHVATTDDGYTITLSDGSTVVLQNGIDGTDGSQITNISANGDQMTFSFSDGTQITLAVNKSDVNEICLPSYLYMLSDTRNDIFVEPFIKRWYPFDYSVLFNGDFYSRRLERVVSVDKPENDKKIIANLYELKNFTRVATHSSRIRLGIKGTGNSEVVAQIIGDSYTQGAFYKDALLRKGYVPNLKLVGLRDVKVETEDDPQYTTGQYDEGRNGACMSWYFEVFTGNNRYHGFMHPDGDFRYWGSTEFWQLCFLVEKGERPNLEATNQVYEGIPDYLRSFSIDERDMTKYVIGTMSDVDTPLTPSLRGARNLSAYLSGVTDEMVQKEREQILDVTQEDIKALADIVQAVLDTRALCVIGNDQQIRAQESMFGEVKNLYH